MMLRRKDWLKLRLLMLIRVIITIVGYSKIKKWSALYKSRKLITKPTTNMMRSYQRWVSILIFLSTIRIVWRIYGFNFSLVLVWNLPQTTQTSKKFTTIATNVWLYRTFRLRKLSRKPSSMKTLLFHQLTCNSIWRR